MGGRFWADCSSNGLQGPEEYNIQDTNQNNTQCSDVWETDVIGCGAYHDVFVESERRGKV
jgi:hypothetical protein